MRFNEILSQPSNEGLGDQAIPDDQEIAEDETVTGTEAAADDEMMSELKSDQVQAQSSLDTAKRSIDIASNLDAVEAAANQVIQSNQGALTPSAAQMLSSTIESIMGSLDLEYKPVASLEAFSSTWSKKAVSESTMESLSESIKEIGVSVIRAIKNAITTAFNFLMNLFKNRNILHHRLKTQSKVLNDLISSSTTKPNTDISGSFIKGMSYKGVFSPYTILDDTSGLNRVYKEVLDVIKALRDGKMDPDVERSLEQSLRKNFGYSIETIKTIDGRQEIIYGALVGSQSFFVDNHFSLRVSPNGIIGRVPESIPVMDLCDLIAMNSEAQRHIRDLIDIEKTSDTISDMLKGFVRNIEIEYGRLRGAMGNDEYQKRTRINDQAKKIQSVLSTSIVRIPNFAFMAIKTTHDLIDANIRAYQQHQN